MKRLLIILIVIISASCQSDKDKISSIFKESRITIEMNTCGCFGCSESTISFLPEASKDDLVTVRGTEFDGDKKITQEELVIIRNLFLAHLESTSTLSGCTSSTNFKILGEQLEVELFEEDCTIESSILKILE